MLQSLPPSPPQLRSSPHPSPPRHRPLPRPSPPRRRSLPRPSPPRPPPPPCECDDLTAMVQRAAAVCIQEASGGALGWLMCMNCCCTEHPPTVVVAFHWMPPAGLAQLTGMGLQSQCALEWAGGNCPTSCHKWGKQVRTHQPCFQLTQQKFHAGAMCGNLTPAPHLLVCRWAPPAPRPPCRPGHAPHRLRA